MFPEEKPAFFSMITGNVHDLFAYSHHFKWWREEARLEQEWAETHHAAGPGHDAPSADEPRPTPPAA